MERLTGPAVMELLRAVVAEKGTDFVYHNRAGQKAGTPIPNKNYSVPCNYLHGDQPGCVVGHVLARAGVGLSTIAAYEGHPAGDFLVESGMTDEVGAAALHAAQAYQDMGNTWGGALKHAEQVFADYRAAGAEEK